MNSDPNNDLEQCTESKLGQVHNAHTHGPRCAQAPRALLHVVARPGPYRAPLPSRVAPVPSRVVVLPCNIAVRTRALARRVAAPCFALCRTQGRAVSQPFLSYHAPPASYRGVCSAVSQRCCAPCCSLSRDTPSNQATLHSRYKNCIVTQLGLNQDTRALPPCCDTKPCQDAKPHAACIGSCRVRGLAVSHPSCVVSWSYRGRA